MFKKIKKLYQENIELKKLKEENKKLKETLIKLDPNFKILPYLKVLDIQTWKTSEGKIAIEMGYFEKSIQIIESIANNPLYKEAFYILLRKITSERMGEIEARDFIYALFICLGLADDIPKLEMIFQENVIKINLKVNNQYNILK